MDTAGPLCPGELWPEGFAAESFADARCPTVEAGSVAGFLPSAMAPPMTPAVKGRRRFTGLPKNRPRAPFSRFFAASARSLASCASLANTLIF